MAIHEQLPKQIHADLNAVGWSKATELAKVARRDGDEFDCATWLHRAKELPKEEFKMAVERHLTGNDSEPWEIIYFKVFKSQIPIVEKALETASMMLGAKRPRSFCLEMICADFIAGASLEEPSAENLLFSIQRLVALLPASEKGELVKALRKFE